MSTIVRPRVGKETLRQVCEKLSIPLPKFRDEWYELVDMEWFNSKVVDSIFDRVARDVGEYEPGSSDCDDFGSCAWEEVKRLYRRKPNRIKGCAIAFGATDIWADPKAEISHDLCILFWWGKKESNDIDNITVGFFEPQECELVSVRKEVYSEATIYV